VEARRDTNNEKSEVLGISWMNAHQERMAGSMNAWRRKTTACQEANLSGDKESAVVHEEVPTERATVKTVRAQKRQYEDQYLAVRHCGQPKKLTQGNCGSKKKFATA
jgi:hypothetical protein